MGALESANRRLGSGSEVPVGDNSDFRLHLLNQVTRRRTTKRGPAGGSSRSSRRFCRWDQPGSRSRAGHDRGHGGPEWLHVEIWIVLATGRQSVFLVSGAKISRPPDVLQNSCHTTLIGVDLHVGPGKIVGETGILCLNTNETGIASGHALPGASSRVIAPSGSDHKERAVATKAKLSERPREVGPSIEESAHAGHVAIPRPCGMVADNAHGSANVAIATVLPSIHRGNLQTAVLQHLK